MKPVWLCLLSGAAFVSVAGAQQDGKKLTARELFYAAVESPAAPSAARKSEKPAATKPKPVRHKSNPATEEAVNRAPSNPSSTEPVQVVQAAYRPTGPRPALGLRYTILKRVGDEQVEVGADTVFHAGDRIRLAVGANDDGHLYVVNRGSSGTWKLLFPSAEIKDGDNRIQGRMKYEIPSGYTFTFDEQRGEEKLFIILSRQPEADVEKLIYSLGKGSPAKGTPPATGEKPKMLLASAAFSDDMIGKLRNAYARDLIVEKVDDEQPGPKPGAKKENAVYAVNPSGSEDSRVVVDVTLKHQ